jgi:hypothetical protein
MAIIKQTTINVDEDTGTKGILVHCWWECKPVKSLWK